MLFLSSPELALSVAVNTPIGIFAKPSDFKSYKRKQPPKCRVSRDTDMRDKARERAAQMEKTMRWWSECTAGWRAKWGVVRDERNRAREETSSLRNALQVSQEKMDGLQGDKREVELELQKTKTALHKLTVSHLQANKSVDVSEVMVERMDAATETAPDTLSVQTQTDDESNVDSFETMSSSMRSLLSPSFSPREKSVLEDKCSDLQTQLSDARNMIEELEAVREALKDEIEELRRERNSPVPTNRYHQSDSEETPVDPKERTGGYRNGREINPPRQIVVPTVHVTTDEDE